MRNSEALKGDKSHSVAQSGGRNDEWLEKICTCRVDKSYKLVISLLQTIALSQDAFKYKYKKYILSVRNALQYNIQIKLLYIIQLVKLIH